jgi:hypothetical protein
MNGVVTSPQSMIDDSRAVVRRRLVAEQRPQHAIPTSLWFAIDGDDDGPDERRPDARILEAELRSGRRNPGCDLEARPHLGAIVCALQRRLVNADGER